MGEAQVNMVTNVVLVAARILLGVWMIINGLNHFVPIFPQPLGSNPFSSDLMVTLIETGLFDIVKIVELIGGVLLIVNRFVPLALVALLPVSAVVYYNAAVLQGKWYEVLYMGTGCFYLNLLVMCGYLKHYLPMMRVDAEMGSLSEFRELPSIFRNFTRYDKSQF